MVYLLFDNNVSTKEQHTKNLSRVGTLKTGRYIRKYIPYGNTIFLNSVE